MVEKVLREGSVEAPPPPPYQSSTVLQLWLRDFDLISGFFQFNKNNKAADRAIAITDKCIYKLDPKKKYKPLKKGIGIQMVRSSSKY